MQEKETIKWIKETWFNNHVAVYQKHGDLSVLIWKQPSTSDYAIRFVFDGNYMYITGDLGTATFYFTEKADVSVQSTYNLEYFLEKLESFKGDIYTFNSTTAVNELKEWEIYLIEENKKYDKERFKKLIEDCKNCSTFEDWEDVIHSNLYFIAPLDYDYDEWIYRIGFTVSKRIQAYLIALQMASEQTKNTFNIEELK